MKLISVIMPVYNEPLGYIKESIESILRQTYKNIELIVVVDDPIREDLVKVVKVIGLKDERVKILINKNNLGLTASLNRALSVINGEFVARMDADDISIEDRLEVQLRYMIDNSLDIVGCNIISIDESGNIMDCRGSSYPTTDSSIKDYLKINGAIPHPTWMVRREVFEKNKYIDFMACEDYGFLLDLALHGYKMGNLKECKLKYRCNLNGISSTKRIHQRVGMYYLRRNYRCGEASNYEGYLSYMNSNVGKRKIRMLKSYCLEKEKIKSDFTSKKYISALFRLGLLLLHSNEPENIIIDKFRKRYLVKKYKEKY